MKIISKTLRILPLLLFVLALQSCSDDDDNNQIILPQQLNIVQTAQATPALSSLVAAIQAANGDLGTVLSGDGPFTVLAPTNDAFDTFLGGTPLDQVDPDVLEQILRNHVISGDISATDLAILSGADGRGYSNTLAAGVAGENVSILFDTNGALPRFNNMASVASADLADIPASNGTVHVIDAVITIPTIVDHVVNNESLSSLEGALIGENLVPLPGNGPYTVFAPTNDAFGSFTNPNTNPLASILANHVIDGAAAFSTGLASGYVTTLAANADADNLSMYVNVGEDGSVMLNGISMVSTVDVVGTDGVIHIVNEVIDLPTIVTHAVANPNFSTLVAALTDLTPTDYVSVLSSNDANNDASPYTVFAPTNAAFGDLLTDLSLASAADIPTATLEATLNLHVLTDLNVRAEDLGGLDGNSVPTFGGPSITIDAGTPAIIDPDGGSNPIIATDVQAINGVIHGISRVIRDL
ncbi:fasciclin domain-containing protein [uncultured Psychroserpens sp.]|uniref:fasciclin domain-containing protein n=1 Tax=uncultured Psychroserpens sp. TaxID=255436 RepID=UPI002627814B|nr:fasciclin domain-containing protein [uncultured Psychroserpens sp.]